MPALDWRHTPLQRNSIGAVCGFFERQGDRMLRCVTVRAFTRHSADTITKHGLFIPYMSRTLVAYSKDKSFLYQADSRRQRMAKEEASRSSPWLWSSLSEVRCLIHSEIARIICIKSYTRILQSDLNKLYDGNSPSYLSSLVRHGPFRLRRKSRDRRSCCYLDTLIRWCPHR